MAARSNNAKTSKGRKESINSLRENEIKYRTLIDQSSGIVLKWDPGGNVLFLNPHGLEFFGFRAEEILGHNVVGTIVAPVDSNGNDLQAEMNLIQHHPDEYYSSENENVRKNGEKVWIAWTNKGIYAPDGTLSKTISFGIDRTKQRAAEHQLHIQYEQLQQEIAKRKRVEAELIKARTLLEERVIERTNELNRVNMRLTAENTERKKVEERIVESEDKYKTLFMLGPDAYYVATLSEGRLIEVNQSFENLFGYSRDEVVGKTSSELGMWVNLIERQQMVKDLQEKGYASLEIIARRKNGETFYTLLSTKSFLLRNTQCIIGAMRDITERKLHEKKLLASEGKYRSLVENINEVLYTLDNQGNITYISPAIERLSKYKAADLIGQPFAPLIHPDDLPGLLERFKQLLSGKIEPWEFRIPDKDGTIKYVRSSSLPVYTDGQITSISAILSDVTERKQVELELEESNSRFRAAFVTGADAYVIVTVDDGRILEVNDRFLKLYGYTRDEVIGRTSSELGMWSNPGTRDELLDQLHARGSVENFEVLARRKGGETFWVLYSVSLLKTSERSMMLGAIRDITEIKKSQEELQAAYVKLEKTFHDAIETMSKIVEMRDPYTAGHQHRVASLSKAIAEEMKLESEIIEQLNMAAIVHDIGKIHIAAEILSKPGKLDKLEYEIIKTHAQRGYEIVNNMDFPCIIAQSVLQHHERVDGSGYPQGLKGEEILLEAKVLSVADVVEAMASHRPYRAALGIDKALDEISKNKGKLYDPNVVDACLKLFTEKGFKFED